MITKDPTRCQKMIWNGSYVGWRGHQCSRKATIEGYCKQHHPDTEKKREAASMDRYAAKERERVAHDPLRLLHAATARIATLERENAKLREAAKHPGACNICQGTLEYYDVDGFGPLPCPICEPDSTKFEHAFTTATKEES